MKPLKIYMAGTMTGFKPNDFLAERVRIARKLEAAGFIPLDPSIKLDKNNRLMSWERQTRLSPKEIVKSDLEMIADSDIFLLDYSRGGGAGSHMELFYAFWTEKRVIIYLKDTQGNVWRKPLSPWIKAHSHKIFKSFDEALDFLSTSIVR